MAWLVLFPLVLAIVAAATPSDRVRAWVVPAGGLGHLALVSLLLSQPPAPVLEGWLALDPVGRLFLPFVSIVFALCALYVPGYLAERRDRDSRVFTAALLGFLAMLTLIVLSQHLGLMWVAIEATTLCAAPLLYFHRTAKSLEATWKYLLVGSVGVALALLGSLFLAYSARHAGLPPTLLVDDLVRMARHLSKPWLHVAFVVLLVGYGTKMGLAPMHTWKPDAYGEAPGVVATLLASTMTSCAFLAILRFFRICVAAGEGDFARRHLLVIGLFSMIVAAAFMARQRDFKRMLAYSSVEHVGVLVVGIGVGGVATFGALLHVLANGFAKGVLFLAAGNLQRIYGSKSTQDVGGALRRAPFAAALFVAGFFAATGTPPFAPFASELTILGAAVEKGRYGVAAVFLGALAVVFMGMGATVLSIVQGDPPEGPASGERERLGTLLPILAFAVLVLVLGVWIPKPVHAALMSAAATLEAP